MRFSTTALIVAAFAATAWLIGPDRKSYAQQIAEQVREARTTTWTTTAYERVYSVDGQRTWVNARRKTFAYLHPGQYREVDYDEAGDVWRVTIADCKTGKTLELDMRNKQAKTGTSALRNRDPRGPFATLPESLKDRPLELVGQKETKAGTVNVLRFRSDKPISENESIDYWIAAKSKQFVGMSSPGGDFFDPLALPDRANPAEQESSKRTILGSVWEEIVFNAQLDADLFRLAPPVGFKVTERVNPTVSEEDFVEWLGAIARYNDDTFPDSLHPTGGLEMLRFNATQRKTPDERTEIERRLIELNQKFMTARARPPVAHFVSSNTVADTFQYIGKGVKVGSAERLVCWYRLKETRNLRAVFGDLTVKDIRPEDLPLGVDK